VPFASLNALSEGLFCGFPKIWADLSYNQDHLSTFPPIIAPIYYEGLGLICISLSGVGLPGVNLIIYKDDLRMISYPVDGANDSNMRGRKVYPEICPFIFASA